MKMGYTMEREISYTCMVQWENSAYFKHVAVILEVNEVGDTMHGLAGVLISVVEAEVEEHVQIQEFPMCCL